MTCEEAAAFVSVIHDGETVPKSAAEHIATCAVCRELLHEYSQIGAEMRLLASRTSEAECRQIYLRRFDPSNGVFGQACCKLSCWCPGLQRYWSE